MSAEPESPKPEKPEPSKSEKAGPPKQTKVSKDDIEAKLRELRGEVDTGVDAAKTPTLALAIGVAVAVVVVAYWMGKRRGKKRQMVLEIRRI